MDTANKEPRSRMVLSKTRTGCRTCKERRVKCDEAKPACQRCIGSKRQCAGYMDTTALYKKPQAFKITYYVPQISSVYWKNGISEDVEEEHALDCFFYWNSTCFPSELTGPFRQQYLLHEPAIRHAMVAMGILHEIYRYKIEGPFETQRRILAMQHYGKAIQNLLSRQHSDTHTTHRSKKTMSISLLACLLFVSLEASQGYYQSALAHLQSGFALFQGLSSNEQQNPKDDSYVSAEILRSFFVRFMCQITHFDFPDCARFLVLAESADEYPAGFPGLEEARESFLAILNKVLSRRHHRGCEKQPGYDYGYDTDKSISEELLELDRWIFSFNLRLTYSVPTSQVCDSYVLVTCAFSLKFRLLMDSRATEQALETTELDLSHIPNLGDTLVKPSPNSATCSTCPLHRLFDGAQNIPQDKNDNNNNSNPVSTCSGQSLFPFLSVFCSVFVSSMYSQNDSIRRKAYDTVSKICRCGKGIDLGLAVYIASLLRPTDKDESIITRSISHNPIFSQVLSEGCWRLLKVLHSFGNLR